MSNPITFDTINLLGFLDILLRDENGITQDAYDALCCMFVATGNIELWHKISICVDATDGRFYIEEDVPFLPTWLK